MRGCFLVDKKHKDKPSTPIHVAGVFSIIGISCLTAFAVNMVLNNVNDQADAMYRDGLSALQMTSEVSFTDESSILMPEQSSDVSEEVSEATEVSKEESKVEESSKEESKPESKPEESSKEESKPEKKPETKPDKPETKPAQDENSGGATDDITDKVSIDFANCSLDENGYLVYTVQTGDWLSTIADRFHTSVDSIGKYNHIKNVDLIYTGDRYVMPVPKDVLDQAHKVLKR